MAEQTDDAPRVTPKEFHAQPGVDDWRIVYGGAHAFFETDSFAEALAFVADVGAVAAELGHDPDLDVRPEGVMVRTFTYAGGRLGPLDAEFARRVSDVARQRSLRAEVSKIQSISIAAAQVDGVDCRPFWAAVMGYEPRDEDVVADPQRRLPFVWTDEIDRPRRGRMHIDVCLPADRVESRVAAALAAGGRVADASHAPDWWTLASPENHGVDIAGWPDVDG